LRDGPSKRKVAPCFRSKFEGKNGMWNSSSLVILKNLIVHGRGKYWYVEQQQFRSVTQQIAV
jgi:hypothetical protein